MRFLLRLLGNDAASADRAAETTASLIADAPVSLAATSFAATIVAGVVALGLGLDIATRAGQ
jgi:hypothetical protein